MRVTACEQRYQELLKIFQAGSLSEPAFFDSTNELEIQSLWFAGQFGRSFTSQSGQPVHIDDFGEWNRAAGPDFLHVKVKINGETHGGDLEIDTRPENWQHHGHGDNPVYNRVCLHVTTHPSDSGEWFTRTSEHRAVESVVLELESIREVLRIPRWKQALTHLGRCSTPLERFSSSSLNSLLEAAARHRLRSKASRFARLEDAHGSDQALFESVAETLGYRPNKLAFRCLAQRLPLTLLRDAGDEAEALIFGTAGLLSPELYEKAPPSSRSYLRRLWDQWWRHQDEFSFCKNPLPNWQLAGQRPANHPHRRLGLLALLVQHWDAFRSICRKAESDPSAMERFRTKLTHPHWNHHYTLSSAPQKKKLALLGKERAQALIVNHLLPRALLRQPSDPWQTFIQLKATQPSDSVRRAATRLLGRREDAAEFQKLLWQHQALIQIYQDFCLNQDSDCSDCPFPEQLQQWSTE